MRHRGGRSLYGYAFKEQRMVVERVGALLLEMTPEELESLRLWLARRGRDLSEELWHCKPADALLWARLKGGTPRLRELSCKDPESAAYYAKEVDGAPHESTRAAACEDPEYAFLYARDVDEGPRDDTRTAACRDPHYAYWYALYIDEGPSDETRTAAAKDPLRACDYAAIIDKGYHPETWKGVESDSFFKSNYEQSIKMPSEP